MIILVLFDLLVLFDIARAKFADNGNFCSRPRCIQS